MNTYICVGTVVQNKKDLKFGTVLSIDRKSGVVVVQEQNSIRTGKIKDVKFVSYREVK